MERRLEQSWRGMISEFTLVVSISLLKHVLTNVEVSNNVCFC